MHRRSFIKALGAGLLMPFIPIASGKTDVMKQRQVIMQNTRLAGSRYYSCEKVWRYLEAGSPLELVRDPRNPHDPLAIEVRWRGRMLGYLPRLENGTASLLMDQDVGLAGRITRLKEYENGWKLLELDVLLLAGQNSR